MIEQRSEDGLFIRNLAEEQRGDSLYSCSNNAEKAGKQGSYFSHSDDCADQIREESSLSRAPSAEQRRMKSLFRHSHSDKQRREDDVFRHSNSAEQSKGGNSSFNSLNSVDWRRRHDSLSNWSNEVRQREDSLSSFEEEERTAYPLALVISHKEVRTAY